VLARRPFATGALAAVAALCAAADDHGGCLLFEPSAGALPSASCAGCHAGQEGPASHVVGVDYAAARGTDLRSAEEVSRRGVRLPEGQVRCTSCHDASSPWKSRVVLPPGTRAVVGIDPRDRTTWELPPRPARPGERVAVKSLCLACHALD
jgi:hypothetical protein